MFAAKRSVHGGEENLPVHLRISPGDVAAFLVHQNCSPRHHRQDIFPPTVVKGKVSRYFLFLMVTLAPHSGTSIAFVYRYLKIFREFAELSINFLLLNFLIESEAPSKSEVELVAVLPDPGSGAFLTPGSRVRDGKKSGFDPG
jgi:hypothetical protein